MQIFIDHFGEWLSQKTGKPLIACKGLVRLALKDEYESFDNLSYEKLKKVIDSSLPSRLSKLNLPDFEKMIQELNLEFKDQKPIFTMASI